MTSLLHSEIIDESEIDDLTLPAKEELFPKSSRDYVDNERLTRELSEWKLKVIEADKEGKERPRLPEYVGFAIMEIPRNIATKVNYNRYSWLEEMISDAVEACCAYIHNFDPNKKGKNGQKASGYSYISMISKHAFNHRIELEKRQNYYKNKSFELAGGIEVFGGEDFGDTAAEGVQQMMNDMINRVYEYEAKQKERLEADRAKAQKQEDPEDKFALSGFFSE